MSANGVGSLIGALDTAVQDTLETMFFTPVELAEMPEGFDGLRATVCFRGDASGYVELLLSAEQARELSANFLGQDVAQIQEKQVESVCGEMANMITGAMLSTAAPTGDFSLDRGVVTRGGGKLAPGAITRWYQTDLEAFAVALNYIQPHRSGEPG